MAAGAAAPSLLPPVKSVVVYRNGDPFYTGRKFVVNQRQVSNMEAFLNEVTQCIGAQLAVRNLYTPRHGHKVTDLQALQTGAQYVAAGFEKFKKLDITRGMFLIIPHGGYNLSNGSFIFIVCSVFRNGDLLCPPFRFIIPRTMQQDLGQILSLITEKVSLRTGAVRRLCSLEGVPVASASELETGHSYVAVGTERFKKLPYLELLVSKAAERYCYARIVCAVLCLLAVSLFKRAGRRRREEVRGAEEVPEDENTATDLRLGHIVSHIVIAI
uniref:Doublecortin domain containing 2B n=1 Tax=Neogobius melanostomus TaxID=47308 RepID=A0A8C6TCK2_9GOBI